MVMASGPGRWPSAANSPSEMRRESGSSGEAGALHDRLVAYVQALDNAHEVRSGVWVEHSYARAGLAGSAGGGGAGDAGAVRVLLAHREPPDLGDFVNVELEDPPPPDPPLYPGDGSDEEGDEEEDLEAEGDEWEVRLVSLAPAAEHARLAESVAESVRRVRLARLAGGRVSGAFARRAEARTLRRTLAPLWLGRGVAPPPPQWLHAALAACAPRSVRHEYDRLVSELRRSAPGLAERLTAGRPPAIPPTVPQIVDRTIEKQVGPGAGPWLAWVGGGRWARRLGALVHTRRVRVRAAAGAPDAWCAAAAGAVRAAVADIVAEAGSRAVVVGGCGGGAALAAGAGAARALLALGAAPAAAEAAGAARGALGWAGPALLVAGGAAAAGWRGQLAETLVARQRLLVVTGADDALRLPARHAARLRLDQRALDAHIAEECARWIYEVCETAEADDEAETEVELDAPLATASRAAESEDEEYSHLPASHSGGEQRAIEIVEGRVVSRVSGGTPLALMPPRRASPRERRTEPRAEPRAERRERRADRRAAEPAAPAPLAAADIMHMPIVFADDDRTVPPPPHEPQEPRLAAGAGSGVVTVRSGARASGGGGGGGSGDGGGGGGSGGGGSGFKYTRVIVAKRGAAGGRPLLLRRGVRLVPRSSH